MQVQNGKKHGHNILIIKNKTNEKKKEKKTRIYIISNHKKNNQTN